MVPRLENHGPEACFRALRGSALRGSTVYILKKMLLVHTEPALRLLSARSSQAPRVSLSLLPSLSRWGAGLPAVLLFFA